MTQMLSKCLNCIALNSVQQGACSAEIRNLIPAFEESIIDPKNDLNQKVVYINIYIYFFFSFRVRKQNMEYFVKRFNLISPIRKKQHKSKFS